MEESSITFEAEKFLFSQIHESGSTIVNETFLDIIHVSNVGKSVDFYCSKKHISINLASITNITQKNCSALIYCNALVCKISVKQSDLIYCEHQLVKIVSILNSAITLINSSSDRKYEDGSKTSNDQNRPPKPQIKYKKENFSHSTSPPPTNPTSTPSPSSSDNSSSRKIPKATLGKRFHTDSQAAELVEYSKIAHSFQASDVLEKIVETEMERIKKEKAGWKIAGGVVGLALGVSDGFDFTDLFTSMAFSNLGGMAQEFASKEQIEFLKKVKSDWLVSQKSALAILQRLGMPRKRTISYYANSGQLYIANIHENPSRGVFLVPLGPAKDHALGFKNDDSLAVLYNSLEEDEINIVSVQLYPIAVQEIENLKRIAPNEAAATNPYHEILNGCSEISRCTLKNTNEQVISYKITIPLGSEY